MSDNLDLMERNEVNLKANGGTELFMRFLYSGIIPRELLENVQIIPGRIRQLQEGKIRVLTLHDLPNDPEFAKLKDPNYRRKFHKIVFISDWQYREFQHILGIPYDNHSIVLESGIFPAEAHEKPKDIVNIAYFTTPHRGLNLLLPVFAKLAESDPNIRLHVHSSFKAYGWEDKDKQFENLFEFARNHPQIEYHGFTDHEELLQKLKTYHIYAYPSIWYETACRAMLESMTAKLLCVHPNLAALPDTSGHLNLMYQGSNNPQEHTNSFLMALGSAIKIIRDGDIALNDHLNFNKFYVDWRYNPNMIAKKWTGLLTDLHAQYPSEESRKVSTDEILIFDTTTGQLRQ